MIRSSKRHSHAGETVSLNFNTNGWDSARLDGKGVTILMRGEFKSLTGSQVEAPLLAKFPVGQGTITFT